MSSDQYNTIFIYKAHLKTNKADESAVQNRKILKIKLVTNSYLRVPVWSLAAVFFH